MYFHRDLNEEQNHTAPRPDILRLPESDSPDLFDDCAPLEIDLISNSSNSTHMTVSEEELLLPSPTPLNRLPECNSPDLFADCEPLALDTVSSHSDSTHMTVSEEEPWEEGQRFPTPTDSEIEAWRAECR